MDDSKTFREELAIQYPTLGRPLWEPDPGGLYHAVQVGDVGFIRHGYFYCLINALAPTGRDRPSGHPPEYSGPYYPHYLQRLEPKTPNHIRTSRYHGKDFRSKNVTEVTREPNVNALGPDDDTQVTFSCSGRHGALLYLPLPAEREDTVALGDFGKWIVNNIDGCMRLAEERGLGVGRMEDIILVTGRHLARSWARAVFSESRGGGQASFCVRVSGDSVVHLEERNVSGAQLAFGPNGENELPENQCIFVRGYHVVRVLNIWPRLRAMAGPAPAEQEPEPESDTRLQLMGVPADSDYQDPLHTLMEYICEQVYKQSPACEVVLVHDNDLECIKARLLPPPRKELETLQPDALIEFFRSYAPTIRLFQCGEFSPRNENAAIVTVATLSEKMFESMRFLCDLSRDSRPIFKPMLTGYERRLTEQLDNVQAYKQRQSLLNPALSSPSFQMSRQEPSIQSKTKLTGLGSHQATSEPTRQGRSSISAFANDAKALSNERLNSATGSAASASPGATPSRPSQTREARPADHRSTAIPAAFSSYLQAIACRDTSELSVEPNAPSRAGQPPADTDNKRNVVSHAISSGSSPKSYDTSAQKAAGAAQHEGVTSSGRLLTNSMRPTKQLRPVTIPPPSRAAQALQDTNNNTPFGLPEGPEPGELRERQQADRTTSVRQSAEQFTILSPLNAPNSPPMSPMAYFVSDRERTAHRMLTNESQVRSGEALLKSHHTEKRGMGSQSRMDPFDIPQTLPLPGPDYRAICAAATTEPSSQSSPVFGQRRLDKSNSLLRGSAGEAKQTTEAPTLYRKEKKEAAALDEYETRSNSSEDHAPSGSAVNRTYFSVPGRGSDFSTSRLSGRNISRMGQPSDLVPWSSRWEPPYLDLGMREPSNTTSMLPWSMAEPRWSPTPTVAGGSNAYSTPSVSQREDNALAATGMEGAHQSEPFTGRQTPLAMPFSGPSLRPLHSGGTMKQTGSSRLDQNKFRHGGLDRHPEMSSFASHNSHFPIHTGNPTSASNLNQTKGGLNQPPVTPQSGSSNPNMGTSGEGERHDGPVTTKPPLIRKIRNKLSTALRALDFGLRHR